MQANPPEGLTFLPGRRPHRPGLLERFLPPLPEGIAETWLEPRLPPGSWLLDPFGAAPDLTVEAARAGYRVVVAANNPVGRFLLDVHAQPPGESDFQSALAELASARRGDERLEPYLRNLYLTHCAQCGQEIMAEAFLWERDALAPYARIYHCPACGDEGERPATQFDATQASHFTAAGLHRARALERIAAPNDPDRTHAEEAIATYLPRAIYALATLINRLDGLLALPPPPGINAEARRRSLTVLALHALDLGNTLWPQPAGRARPKQLSIPPKFRENNLWLALESAASRLANPAPLVSLSQWPTLPPADGGLVIFEGRLKELVEELQILGSTHPIQFGGVLGGLPRPNQAFWTLSALWAGWLWGREAIGPFKSVLRRRRYDWGWHTTALEAAMSALAEFIPTGTPMLALIGETEAAFLTAALVAGANAGFCFNGLAVRDENGQAQIAWGCEERKPGQPASGTGLGSGFSARARHAAVEAGKENLHLRNEATHQLSLHAAGLARLVDHGVLPPLGTANPAEIYSAVQEACDQAFSSENGFLRFGGGERTSEGGHWWHSDLTQSGPSLADQVEMAVVRTLQAKPGISFSEVDSTVCAALPGLLTPGQNLVSWCLESYGEQSPAQSDHWQLRQADSPAERRADLAAMRALLANLGTHLGYTNQGEKPYLWIDESEQVAFAIFVIASAIFSELVFTNQYPPDRSLIVLPGARANLAVFKLQRDPRLRQVVDQGWRFVKFRHLRRLVESPVLNRQNLAEMLTLDPLTDAPSQMRLF
jgi:hypothetical protein